MTATKEELTTSIKQLLKHAYRQENSGKTCRNALLAACYPGHYKLDYGDLFSLDRQNTNAALNILTYRLNTMDSVERLIGSEEFQKLHNCWAQDQDQNN